ncbi:MAG: tRNA (adenosine(37)-N6)-threonylcarbamoyltransferase complex ATPase subunit type 1 TsaE [Candidatus Marinimicrobia bacterium]|nr:tRNA (adenosine(37)-N6)-threonylcarbamoyltransferase complex ATPase subunit type 1 TsaE [Candidatus Neomarinimicrobiota bacterium]
MIKSIFTSNSTDETQVFASNMAKSLPIGTVVALIGDLGTGKTTFSQGCAKGFGVEDFVNSPTFKLVSQYDSPKGQFNHVDCYRLENPNDFLNIGGELLLNPEDGITLIEWADIIENIIPDDTIIVRFSRNPEFMERRVLNIEGWKP